LKAILTTMQNESLAPEHAGNQSRSENCSDINRIQFQESHLVAFCHHSGDRNPLHLEASYAELTPFGQKVVFGIAGVVEALGRWAGDRLIQLQELIAEFKKPLFVGVQYILDVEEAGGRVHLRLFRGDSPQLIVRFRFTAVDGCQEEDLPRDSDSDSGVKVRDEALEPSSMNRNPWEVRYAPNEDATAEFFEVFTVRPQTMPRSQLMTLLWSSYFVGMEWPGKQALFSSLRLEFDAKPDSSNIFSASLSTSYQPRFSLLTTTGSSNTASKIKIDALVRPEPVKSSLEAIRESSDPRCNFSGKNILITGAARGFGSVLARSCASANGQVMVNYRRPAEHLDTLRDDLASLGSHAPFFKADLADLKQCRSMADEIREAQLRIDYLFLNAFPAILPIGFLEQEPQEMLSYINSAMALTIQPLWALWNRLNENATVVLISTEYTQKPVKHLSHYIATKSGLEGLWKSLAAEHAKIRFKMFNPGMMLTDQTNSPFHLRSLAAPPVIASGMIRELLLSD